MNKYEQNLILIMQMHYQEIKYNLKNDMYKISIKDCLQEKNRSMKIRTNFRHSTNVALEINK